MTADTDTAPQCRNTGCTRDCSYDSEPPGPGSYFSTCERCTTVSAVTLHAHRHRYTPAQCEANGYDPSHTWLTTTNLHPVVEDDVIVAWVCNEGLPQDGGPCPYRISAVDLEVHMAWARAENALSALMWRSDSTPVVLRTAWLNARDARSKAFPVDVPN